MIYLSRPSRMVRVELPFARCDANGRGLQLSPRITSTIDYLFTYASGIREVHRPKTQHHSQDTERHQKIRDIHMCRQYNANGRHAWLLEYHDSLVQIRRVIGCLGIRSPSSYKTTKSFIRNVLTYSQGLRSGGNAKRTWKQWIAILYGKGKKEALDPILSPGTWDGTAIRHSHE